MADHCNCRGPSTQRRSNLTIKRLTVADFIRLRSKLKPAVYNKTLHELSVSNGSSGENSLEMLDSTPNLQ